MAEMNFKIRSRPAHHTIRLINRIGCLLMESPGKVNIGIIEILQCIMSVLTGRQTADFMDRRVADNSIVR